MAPLLQSQCWVFGDSLLPEGGVVCALASSSTRTAGSWIAPIRAFATRLGGDPEQAVRDARSLQIVTRAERH